MTDVDSHTRSALLPVRRASGPTYTLDRSAATPLPDRLHRAPSPSDAKTDPTTSYRSSSSFDSNQSVPALTRSFSSDAPTSGDSSRPQSMHSEGGSVEKTASGLDTASTASPLDTPGDGHPLYYDSLLPATKRALTAKPALYTATSNDIRAQKNRLTESKSLANGAAIGNKEDAKGGVETEKGMGVPRRGDTAGGASTTTDATEPTSAAWHSKSDAASSPWASPFPAPASIHSSSAILTSTLADPASNSDSREGRTDTNAIGEHWPHMSDKKVSDVTDRQYVGIVGQESRAIM
jgi:hypothetical protein